MLSCIFWIIGGQHTIKAIKDYVMHRILYIMGGIIAYCSNHKIVVMWYANKMFMCCTCPTFLNSKINDKGPKPLIMTKTMVFHCCHESLYFKTQERSR